MFNLKAIVGASLWLISSLWLFYTTLPLFHNTSIFFNFFLHDVMSIFIILTTSITLIVSLSIADNKYFIKTPYLFLLFFIFIFIIFGLVQANNMVSFFVFYELLLVPSFILVRKSSPNRRSEPTSNYFLLWTQLGSFLVLIGIFLYTHKTTSLYFFFNNFLLYNAVIQILIFFGFGVKVPLWPFHFWLSKTHVEANTGFSIFLSGILVKAAVFGLYKFSFIFNCNIWFFITVIFISVIDGSLKMCVQVDLKKLVAFSTIQEMAFMSTLFATYNLLSYQILFAFIIFHTLISSIFFLIVDFLYRRYNTRVSYNVTGACNIFPNLSFLNVISVYLFVGIPLTIKFSIEVFLIKIFLNFHPLLLTVIAVFANYLSILFFFKTFILINFGNVPSLLGTDITKKEVLLLLTPMIFIVLINFV